MNILIVGSGAREHAIAAAFCRSAKKPAIFCCGTSMNPGIKQLASDYWIGDITDVGAVLSIAKIWQIDLAIIGPEAPLEKGLADILWETGIATVGPKKVLAQIETSKTFARDLMQTFNIAGLPRYRTFLNLNGIETFLQELGEGNFVIKANGLMGGASGKILS